MTERFSDPRVERSTLVDYSRHRALLQPDQRAYTFLVDGEAEERHLTYAELDRQARAIAALLQREGAAGERALLLYPPGLEYVAAFFGCLYAGVVAVPAYPPNPARLERTLPRLRAIVSDAQPAVALTTSPILAVAEGLLAHDPAFQPLRWHATDTLSPASADDWRSPALGPDTLAFLQYTSGSTAAPKGVMLTHGNLLHNSALIAHAFDHTPASRGVIWLPPYHDMGLIGGVIQPLYASFPVVLMSPVDFLQRPLRWLQAVSRYGATTSGGPNFAYDLCVRKIAPEQRATLDLSSWTVAFNGAEPIRPDTLDRFVEAFGPCGFRREAFYPCYGLAEATLIVTGGAAAAPPVARAFQGAAIERHQAVAAAPAGADSRPLVGCGRSLLDQQIVIADPDRLRHCRAGQIGEIWVAGPSVAQGYWGRPEATAQTFHAYLADSGAGPFLRTGDLGFIADGELFITGRLKDLIIIRGRNHYPQDIELTVERSHPALRPGCGAAFAIDVAGEERLVVVQEVERQYRSVDVAAVVGAIRQAVATQHEAHAYAVTLLKTGSIPKTSSGKIQRHACRAAFLAGELEAIGGSTLDESALADGDERLTRDKLLTLTPEERQQRLEAYLREQVAQVLRVAPSSVDPRWPVSNLGLDSLMAIELQHGIETGLGAVVPMASFLESCTIAQLAAQIDAEMAGADDSAAPPTSAQAAIGVHPLSYGQQALWFLHQLAPESAAYNIASAVRMTGELDVPGLRRALQALVDRHSALRATFAAPHGTPVQQIDADATLDFRAVEAITWSTADLDAHLAAEAHRPFDLARGPLLRVTLFRRAAREHLLLLVVHHLVADLWSLALLVQDLRQLYPATRDGRPLDLPPLTHHYADYVHWQAGMLAGVEGERLWSYWRQQLAAVPPTLELPTDRPRPAAQTYRGAAHPFALDPALTERLNALARAAGTTLYTTLLAAFQALLFRYTGQTDFLVGSPASGRGRAAWAEVVGYCVNPVVLRADLTGNPPFTALLARARQTVQAALAHQDYPFALLVERLQPEHDPSRSPLFQVLFALQRAQGRGTGDLGAFALGANGARLALGELTVEAVALEQQVAQFDLTLLLAEADGGLAGTVQYNADLFDRATIARMAAHFQTLLAAVVADPERRVADLPLLTDAERRQLLVEWNATAAAYPQAACMQQLVETQAARTPDAVALVFGEAQLTYRELNQRANRLAHYLRRLGIGPEVRAGICVERSPELVVGLLGVLKAGGAYVPLDPAYPQDRLAFMLDDARARVLLTSKGLGIRGLGLGIWDQELARKPQTSSLKPHAPSPTPIVVCLDADWERIAEEGAEDLRCDVTAENLAYVIYTSGSTGRPKGVAIAHRSAVAMLAWARAAFTPKQLAGVLAATSICFDLSVFELFVPLSWGGTVVLAESALHLPALPAAQRVTLVNTVPSAIAELLRVDGVPDSVCTVNLAGEPLARRLVQQLYRRAPIRQVLNLYGPSEDTTYSTWAVVAQESGAPPPIGRPIANTQAYVLDARMQPVPVGIAGELYLGGAGLARGYLNRPDLTAERFIPDLFADQQGARDLGLGTRDWDGHEQPLAPNPKPLGARLYRTGDLARYRPDGNLEFLGRLDHQVKVRGYRIELGEIEATLLQHQGVRESVVVVREDVPGEQRLVGYVVPATDHQPRATGTETRRHGDTETEDGKGTQSSVLSPQHSALVPELRAFLRERLPEYMVPSAFALLEALPLTPNGKLDRRALPAPDQVRLEQEHAYAAPRTAIEEQVVALWAEILGVERVGIYDNFFNLGGHSLQATRLLSRLCETFQVDLPLRGFFEAPRVADLAVVIAQKQGEQLERAALAQMLAELEQLSEDEARTILATERGAFHGSNRDVV